MGRDRQGSLLLLHITFQNLSRDNFGEDPLPQEVAEVLPGFVLHHARAITPKNLAISPMIQGEPSTYPCPLSRNHLFSIFSPDLHPLITYNNVQHAYFP